MIFDDDSIRSTVNLHSSQTKRVSLLELIFRFHVRLMKLLVPNNCVNFQIQKTRLVNIIQDVRTQRISNCP